MSSDGSKSHAQRRLLLIGALALGACGFTPVYGPGGSGDKLQNALQFSAPETEFGFRVRTTLEDRFGLTGTPLYTVEIGLNSKRTTAAIDVDGDTTRFDISGTAAWVLSTLDGSTVTRGEVQTSTSYSATGTTVATQTAERDSRARLAQALADLIATDLIFASGRLP